MQRHAQFLGPPIENAFEVHKMSQHSMHHTFAFFISLLLFIALKCTSFHVVSVALQLLRPRFHFDFLNRLLPTLLSSCGDSLFRFLNSFEQSYSSGQFAKCVHNNKSLFFVPWKNANYTSEQIMQYKMRTKFCVFRQHNVVKLCLLIGESCFSL